MRPIRGLVVAVLAGWWLAACASQPVVRSDWDRTADFSAYRTFGFATPQGTDPSGYESLETQRLRAAVRREMRARGLAEAADPDLLVDFRTRAQERINVLEYPAVWAPCCDYWSPWYPRGFYGSRFGGYTDVQVITEGVLSIDLIDRAGRRIVWEGSATGQALQGDEPLAATELDETVRRIFQDFPPAPQP